MLEELFAAQPRLANDRSQRPGGELAVHRDDDDPAVVRSEFEVAAALASPPESSTFECSSGFVAGDPREPRAHAGTSTGVMMSGSGTTKSGSSSK